MSNVNASSESSATATATAKPSKGKPSKGKPAPAVSPLVKALEKALALATKSKPAKVFDSETFAKTMAKLGLPASFVENATREAQKKFESEHGNEGEQITRQIVSLICIPSGGIESFSLLVGRMAKEARAMAEADKVSATFAEWTASLQGTKDCREDLQTLADKASDLRKDGKPWSEVGKVLNLSENAGKSLYLAAKDFPDVFPAKSATE